MMRSTYVDKYRRDQRMKTSIDKTEELYHLNVEDTHTFNQPDRSLEYQFVMECINKIDPTLRTPFKMYMEGFKYHEIVEKLNTPMGTVKNRIFNARKEIQKHLAEENTSL